MPDDTTKFLLADFILDLITSVLQPYKQFKRIRIQRSLLSGLVESLQKSLSEALHIPDHADKVTVRCVTDMISEEVNEGLDTIFSGCPQKGSKRSSNLKRLHR